MSIVGAPSSLPTVSKPSSYASYGEIDEKIGHQILQQDSSIGILESFEALLGMTFEFVRWGDTLDHLSDDIPESSMLLLDHEHNTSGVGAKGRRRLLECHL